MEVNQAMQQLLEAPAKDWYNKLKNKQEDQIVGGSQPAGGQLIIDAVNHRAAARELREMLAALPQAYLRYSEAEMRECDGFVIELRRIAVHAAAMGLSRLDICKLLGLNPKRFMRYLERGLEGEYPYNTFASAFLQAEVLCDLDAESGVRDAIALEYKTAGAAIRMLERRDSRREAEKAVFDDLPLELFSDSELEDYEKTGKIPLRFKNRKPADVVDAEIIEEDASHIAIYRLKMQLAEAEKKIQELEER